MIKPLLLSQVVTASSGDLIGTDAQFNRVSTDTRTIEKGDLLVALRGENFDAHNFLEQAQKSGAQAFVIDRSVHSDTSLVKNISVPLILVDDTTKALGVIGSLNRQNFQGKLVALTGSCGKTTVKEILSSILSIKGKVTKTQGNLNNHIGAPQTLLSIAADSDYAVVELGASGLGEIDYLALLAGPDVALVNNVASAHLSGFGTVEGVAAEKSKIYQHLMPSGTAIINLDEPFAAEWLQKLAHDRPDLRVITFSLGDNNADVEATNLNATQSGSYDFILSAFESSMTVSVNMQGRHNVSNALAAAACALALGVDMQTICDGLKRAKSTDGRMQTVLSNSKLQLVDDSYNANPESVKAAAHYLNESSNSDVETILVLGGLAELGDDADLIMKALAADLAGIGVSHLVTVSNEAKIISDEFCEQSKTGRQFHFDTHEQAANHVNKEVSKSNKKTIVLVKGSRSFKMEKVVQLISNREGA
jgi:UDP-N-acetylmuramoyl-tripeptide--D-alanyl-D-alanine ligase